MLKHRIKPHLVIQFVKKIMKKKKFGHISYHNNALLS